jgi:DNA-binding MarR family transcriptional regulator
VTGITDQLVQEDLVERVQVPGDRRAYRVRLTPKGRAHFVAMAHVHEAWVVDAFDALTEREQETLHRLLGKVKQHSHSRIKDTP